MCVCVCVSVREGINIFQCECFSGPLWVVSFVVYPSLFSVTCILMLSEGQTSRGGEDGKEEKRGSEDKRDYNRKEVNRQHNMTNNCQQVNSSEIRGISVSAHVMVTLSACSSEKAS